MRKKLVIIISLFVLILVSIIAFITYSNYIKTKEAVTGKIVTGEATDANFAISISVTVETLEVTLIYPENKTYITTKNLWLNYSKSNAYFVWYSIDNVENITLTENILFNTTLGLHTIRIYANNTEGVLVSDSVTFTVDSSKFRVIYDEYAGSTKGTSTDFNKSSYENLQDLSNIVLENTDWGKIQFYEGINMTNDADFSDSETNLDNNTNISKNRIEINSTALPNFNTSATLYLYNLTFSDPRVLRDDSVCPDTICTEIDYTGGTLIFNVTQFTVYSAEETPEEAAPAAAPSKGGVSLTIKSFTISPEEIKVKLKQGQTTAETILITNNGNQKLSFSITNPKLEEFLKITPANFTLNPGESKTIVLDFLVRENTIPDLYIGKFIIKADGIEKEILTAIEVVTRGPLFDVGVTIPNRFLYVLPGEELFSEIKLFNLGQVGEVDLQIDYIIKDEDGNDIIAEHETVAVATQTTFSKTFNIPEDAKYGRYVLYVKATYNEKVASATAWFNVGKRPFWPPSRIVLFIIAGVVILIIIILLKIKKIKKKPEKEIESFKEYRRRIKREMKKHKK